MEWFLDNLTPKGAWAYGTIANHPEPKELNDVDKVIGLVEHGGGHLAYFYCSRTQAHGHDFYVEITATEGKLVMINVLPKRKHVVVADKRGMTVEVPVAYWERFEDALATEAHEFVLVLDDTDVPLPVETGLMVMRIGRSLQDALVSGKRIQFDEKGSRLDSKLKL